jgi:hypothetical protein
MTILLPNKSLQATRDGRFLRRRGYGGQASSASRFTSFGPARVVPGHSGRNWAAEIARSGIRIKGKVKGLV